MPPVILSCIKCLWKVCYNKLKQGNFQKTDVGDESQNICQELSCQWGFFRKYPNRGRWGYEISRGIKKIVCGISGGQEEIMWNFQGSLFVVLEFPRDRTQFFGISRGLALFCLEFLGVKLKKWKIPGWGNSPMVILNHFFPRYLGDS